MRFLTGRSDAISNSSFAHIKWLLSSLSAVMTTGLVVLLQTHA